MVGGADDVGDIYAGEADDADDGDGEFLSFCEVVSWLRCAGGEIRVVSAWPDMGHLLLEVALMNWHECWGRQEWRKKAQAGECHPASSLV